MKKYRDCETCGSERKESLYSTVVMCKDCGFVYSEITDSQEDLNTYYANTNEYNYINAMDDYKNREIFKTLSNFDVDNKILDVGVGNGLLLSILKTHGYKYLSGLDPNTECVKNITKQGIISYEGTIFENQIKEKYDVIIFNHVLEHIVDLNRALDITSNMLELDGMVFVEFPNISLYNKECTAPYSHVVDGHVNHFDWEHLVILFKKHGYQLIDFGDRDRTVSSFIIFKKLFYGEFKLYIEKSRIRAELVNKKVDELVASKEPIYVWGMGSNLRWLKENTKLMDCNIVKILDSKMGKPELLNHRILITPVYLAEDIKRQLKRDGYKNKTFILWEA